MNDTPCRLGLWGVFDVEDIGPALYAHVVRAELGRRLPAASIRTFSPEGRLTRADRGEPAEAPGPDVAAALDLVVVADPGAPPPPAGVVVRSGVDLACHPAVLGHRAFPPDVLEKRLEYLRLMGWYPTEGDALVVEGPAPALRPLLDDHPGLTPVELPAFASLEDVAAAVSAAAAVVASSPAVAMLALGYGTPYVMGGEADLAGAFATAMKSTADDLRRRLGGEIDAWLDSVAAAAVEAAPADLPDPARPALERELRALRRAYRARAGRANAERVVLADQVARMEAELTVLRPEVERLRQQVAAEVEGRVAAEAEVAALHATRTFRWTGAARSIYRRLGGGRR